MVVAGLAAVAQTSVASAQSADDFDRDGSQSVRTRTNPDYDAVGVPAGGFRFYPRLGLSAEWNDNVFTATTNEVDDIAYTVSADGRLVSDWNTHFLAFQGSVQDTTYQDSSEDLETVWSLGAEGRIDVQRGFAINADAAYSDTYEPRGSNDPNGLAEPIRYPEQRAGVEVSREFNRLRLSGRVRYNMQDFEDGVLVNLTPVDQDFRDRTVMEYAARADYAVSPDTALYVSYSYRTHDYDQETLGNRDFQRQRALVGAAFDVTNVLRGEIGAGYTWAEYDVFTGADDPNGLTFSGSLDWFLTQLTTVNLAVERDIGDSGDPGAPSRILTDIGLRVDHELYRNVIVFARGGWAEDDYNGAPPFDRVDETTSGAVGCDWLLNRTAAIQARFTYTERESDGLSAARDYEQNRFTLGFTLRR
jgi:hypothetical protein